MAYERPTEGYTVRYSQWGAHGYRLLESVTASTPLGGTRHGEAVERHGKSPRGRDAESTNGQCDGSTDDDGTQSTARGPTRVRPGPLGVASDLSAVAASFVDVLAHEAVFVVSASFRVRVFEPLAFWGHEPTSAYGGALVSLRRERDPRQDARELRAWRRGATALAFADVDEVSVAERVHDPAAETVSGPDDLPGRSRCETSSTPVTAECERIHEQLLDALERDATGRSVFAIPPRTHDR